jgi:hypothetical protein
VSRLRGLPDEALEPRQGRPRRASSGLDDLPSAVELERSELGQVGDEGQVRRARHQPDAHDGVFGDVLDRGARTPGRETLARTASTTDP